MLHESRRLCLCWLCISCTWPCAQHTVDAQQALVEWRKWSHETSAYWLGHYCDSPCPLLAEGAQINYMTSLSLSFLCRKGVITTIIGLWWFKWDNKPGIWLAPVAVRLTLIPLSPSSHWCQLHGLMPNYYLPRFLKLTGPHLPENCTVSSDKSRVSSATTTPFIHLLLPWSCHLGPLFSPAPPGINSVSFSASSWLPYKTFQSQATFISTFIGKPGKGFLKVSRWIILSSVFLCAWYLCLKI